MLLDEIIKSPSPDIAKKVLKEAEKKLVSVVVANGAKIKTETIKMKTDNILKARIETFVTAEKAKLGELDKSMSGKSSDNMKSSSDTLITKIGDLD